MSNKSKACNYRKSKFVAGTIATLAFSIAFNSPAFAEDITITSLARINEDIANGGADAGYTYFLASNLDLADVEVTGPVFTYVTGTFTGIFNGNGFTISNLSAPLFDVIGNGSGQGTVSNLGLKTTESGISINASNNKIGVLAGALASSSTVTEVAVSGSISAVAQVTAGGLVGEAGVDSVIENSSSSVSVSTVGEVDIQGVAGGLVGFLDGGSVHNSLSTGSVTSTSGNTNAGGLVGNAFQGLITNSTSTGTVTVGGEGEDSVEFGGGGLVGVANGTEIRNSSASGAVTNIGGADYTGGLVGELANGSEIENSAASGAVTSTGSFTGGLVGVGSDGVTVVSDSKASGSVTVSAPSDVSNIGGLVGGGLVIVSQSSASGNVSVTSGDGINCVGGLVGCGYAVVDSSASGSLTINALEADRVGGLIGEAEVGPVMNSSASGNVTVSAAISVSQIGGLVGRGKGVSNSSASGAVNVTSVGAVSKIGGLGGYIQDAGGEVSNSSAIGNVSVSGIEIQYVGGLVGLNESDNTIDSTASGDVTVIGDGEQIGSLVGGSYAITNSSASGDVTATSSRFVGGLAGQTGEIENSEAHGDVSGQQHVGSLVGVLMYGIWDSLATGTTTENGNPVDKLEGDNPDQVNQVTEEGAIQGLIGDVGPTSSPDPVTEIDEGAQLLNTENEPLVWGENEYVNGGLPYLLALRANGFYADLTPDDDPSNASEDTNPRLDKEYFEAQIRLIRYLLGDSTIRITNSDFTALGARKINEAHLPVLLNLLKELNPLTVNAVVINENAKKAEILHKTSLRLFRYLAGDSTIQIKPEDFTEVGVVGATKRNIPILLKLLKEVDPYSLDARVFNKIIKKANIALKMSSKNLVQTSSR